MNFGNFIEGSYTISNNIINCIVTSARGEHSPLQKAERKIFSLLFSLFSTNYTYTAFMGNEITVPSLRVYAENLKVIGHID